MPGKILTDTVHSLFEGGKGLLAMDASDLTCNKRFARYGIPQTEDARRSYRELIVTTPELGESIGGVILYDDTIRQHLADGTPFIDVLRCAGMIPGIKVDRGTKAIAGFPGERVTEGLDGLRARLDEYSQFGARFAKWRAVIAIDDGIPTMGCIEANMHALARFAATCQEADIVPVVEPDVLMDGMHTLGRCSEVTQDVLRILFEQLSEQRVDLRGMILRPSMVLPGISCPTQEGVEQVADSTLDCLVRAVPATMPVVAFLSGGQPYELATDRLNAMNARSRPKMPWTLTFAFARAIQQPALEIWKGQSINTDEAQRALYHRAKCNSAACLGEYTSDIEKGFY